MERRDVLKRDSVAQTPGKNALACEAVWQAEDVGTRTMMGCRVLRRNVLHAVGLIVRAPMLALVQTKAVNPQAPGYDWRVYLDRHHRCGHCIAHDGVASVPRQRSMRCWEVAKRWRSGLESYCGGREEESEHTEVAS